MNKQTLLSSMTVVLMLLPNIAGAVQLKAEDSIAGLGLAVEVTGMRAGSTADVRFTMPDERTKSVAATADASGRALATLSDDDTTIAGIYEATLPDGESVRINVLPDSIDAVASTVEVRPLTIDADGEDSAEITVTLFDRYGNPLAGRPVTLISSRPEDRVDALTAETDGSGRQAFMVSSDLPGHASLRAVDLLSGQILEETGELDVGRTSIGGRRPYDPYPTGGTYGAREFYGDSRNPSTYGRYLAQSAGFDVIDRFDVTAPEKLPRGEEASKVIIRAVDRNGQTVEDYVGTVVFSSTDPEAILPNFGEYVFKQRDLGQKEFPLVVKFSTNGEQVFRVEDKADPSISGEATIEVGGASSGNGGNITITSHADGGTVSATTIIVTGTGPAYANIIISGGAHDVDAETDRNGNFSAEVDLNPASKEFILRAHDDSGRFDSGPVHLTLDADPPELKSITFQPAEPTENTMTLVAVETEADTASVTFSFVVEGQRRDVQLSPVADTPGRFQALFPAPPAGLYQPIIRVKDAAGNGHDLQATMRVQLKGLPTVEHVQAEARTSSILLTWDPVAGDVDGYRVYIGEKPDAFSYTLETGKPVTKATIAGLTASTTYYFAVTAISRDVESTEKSAVVSANLLGLNLTVTPKDGALDLQWDFPKDTPLSAFLLQYGVEPGAYTERRMLNGSLRVMTMRDLLNGIPYHIRLVPITVTGEKLDELAAVTSGTPSGDPKVFRPGTSDPVPFDPNAAQLPNVPHTPSNGLPSSLGLLLMAVAAVAVLHRSKRKENKRTMA